MNKEDIKEAKERLKRKASFAVLPPHQFLGLDLMQKQELFDELLDSLNSIDAMTDDEIFAHIFAEGNTQ